MYFVYIATYTSIASVVIALCVFEVILRRQSPLSLWYSPSTNGVILWTRLYIAAAPWKPWADTSPASCLFCLCHSWSLWLQTKIANDHYKVLNHSCFTGVLHARAGILDLTFGRDQWPPTGLLQSTRGVICQYKPHVRSLGSPIWCQEVYHVHMAASF